MKTIKVVAAVIFRTSESGTKEILATQRGYGEFKDWWEFPGGKIEEGETPQQALTREIKEELDAEISVGDCIGTVEYDYPAFHLSMDCFYCTLVPGHYFGYNFCPIVDIGDGMSENTTLYLSSPGSESAQSPYTTASCSSLQL